MERIATRGFLSIKEVVHKRTLTATDFRSIFFDVRYKGSRTECRHILLTCREFQSTQETGHIKVRLFDANDNEVALDGANPNALPVIRSNSIGESAVARAFDTAMVHNATSDSDPQRVALLARQPGLLDLFGDLRVDGGGIITPPEPPLPPPPPPPGERVEYIVQLNHTVHPEGIWRAEFHNLDDERDQTFICVVDFPAAVVTLRETRLPFELFRNPFAEIIKLINLSVKIDDGQAVVHVRDEFAEIVGIDTTLTFGVRDDIKDISLAGHGIEIGQSFLKGMGVLTLSFEFEDEGPDEIDVPLLPDVDLDNLAGRLELFIGLPYDFDPHEVYYLRNGEETPWPVHLMAKFSVDDIDVSTWGKVLSFLFGKDINEEVEMLANRITYYFNDTLRRKYRDYLVDVMQYLARHDHVIHAISCDADGFIVRHHSHPDVKTLEPVGPGTKVREHLVTLDTLRRPFAGLPQPTLSEVLERNLPNHLKTRLRTEAGRTRGDDSDGTSEDPPPTPPFNAVDLSIFGERLEALGTSTLHPGDREEREVEHIVVLTMENRSFDHMLGYLKLEHGRAVIGLTNGMSNSSILNPAYQHVVRLLDRTVNIRSPHHGHDEVMRQIADGAMSGFIDSYETFDLASELGQRVGDVMGYYHAVHLPFYHFAASEYAVCDKWFCSHPGPTFPNRFASISGVIPSLDNFDIPSPDLGYTKLPTIFDLLTALGISWNYVEHDVGFLRIYDKYRIDTKNIITYDRFRRRLSEGRLPAVTYVDPSFVDIPPSFDANDDHPPADIYAGQHLCADLYAALTANPALWRKTLFVIVYDEHGGFFDHVSPKESDFDEIPKIHPGSPNMYGPRVPALLISPWVNAGSVINTEFDHTSIIRTIMKLFCPERFHNRELFGPRVDRVNDLTSELRTAPRSAIPPFNLAIPAPRAPDIRFHDQGLRNDYHYMMQRMALNTRQRERLVV